jgi:hypothetical protein
MRCSFNITGTKTYRFSASKNPFGNGANLETIPKGTEKDFETKRLKEESRNA